MKTIEVDEDLYRYIAGQTLHIGESASDILRRLLNVDGCTSSVVEPIAKPVQTQGIIVSKEAGKEQQVDVVKEMRSLLISDEFATLKKAIDRFMLILSTLYRIDSQGFSAATEVKGRKRLYFADNQQTLLQNSSSTKPKLIPETPFWVITNTNTDRKRHMVELVMRHMSLPADLVEKVASSI